MGDGRMDQFIQKVRDDKNQLATSPPAIIRGLAKVQAVPTSASSGSKNPKAIEQSVAKVRRRKALVK